MNIKIEFWKVMVQTMTIPEVIASKDCLLDILDVLTDFIVEIFGLNFHFFEELSLKGSESVNW